MFENEGYKFMGAAFEVYNQLGYGMAEEIYQQSLEVELGLRSISFQSKCELSVFYKGNKLETTYKPDLLVFGAIVVELKAVKEMLSEHEAQLFNYMRIARQPVGYLINFGRKGDLDWKRFVLSDLKDVRNTHLRESTRIDFSRRPGMPNRISAMSTTEIPGLVEVSEDECSKIEAESVPLRFR